MVRHFDHITLVVRDLEAAKWFFALLGFEHERSVVISGEVFSTYGRIQPHVLRGPT
jgi:catechol 2,3-dioxygenase-like lactoylglutathione lyase family enzyme